MKHAKSFYVIAFSSLIALTLLTTGCGKKETPVDKATREKILLVGNGAEPVNLDPAFSIALNDARIQYAIFESLLTHDVETLDPRPGVATDWNVSSDGLTYTFHLRKNARFSNGDPITAHDFIFSIKRTLSPSLGSSTAIYLFVIKNGKNYHTGMLTDFDAVGVKALNDHTLQFQLENPDPFFLFIAATSCMIPLHQPTLDKFNATHTMNGTWLRAGNFVGNGPFTIAEWSTNDYIETEKNPYYWNADIVKLNKIRFYAMSNLESQERAFRAGQLHIVNDLPIQQAILYRKRKDPNFRSHELNGVYAYVFNTDVPPLNDLRVRKALAMAISRRKITDEVIQDGRKPAYNLIPCVIPGYHPIFYIQEDIPKAQELLAQAGFPNGKGFPELEILFNSDASHLAIAETIQAMWKKNLNINIKLVNTEWKVLLDKESNQDYQIIRCGWLSEYMDPSDILKDFSLASLQTPTGWKNSQFEDLLNTAQKARDIPTRFKLLAEAEAILMDELPTMPISFHVGNYLVHPSVRGWATNSAQINYFQFIDLVPTDFKN